MISLFVSFSFLKAVCKYMNLNLFLIILASLLLREAIGVSHVCLEIIDRCNMPVLYVNHWLGWSNEKFNKNEVSQN